MEPTPTFALDPAPECLSEVLPLRRVLIVDDHPELAQAVAQVLRRDFEVVVAFSAEEAFRVLRDDGPFAVIVSDYEMPGQSGAQFFERIKGGWPEVARVLVTGRAEVDVAAEALRRGDIQRFLKKPVRMDALFEAVDAGIERHKELVADRSLNGELAFAREALTHFTGLLEERVEEQSLTLSRLHELALSLNAVGSLQEIAELAASAAAKLLGGRAVHLELDGIASGALCAGSGEFADTEAFREPVNTPEGRVGAFVVEERGRGGQRLSSVDRRVPVRRRVVDRRGRSQRASQARARRRPARHDLRARPLGGAARQRDRPAPGACQRVLPADRRGPPRGTGLRRRDRRRLRPRHRSFGARCTTSERWGYRIGSSSSRVA